MSVGLGVLKVRLKNRIINMPQVIVVPETSEFSHTVSHSSVVWINPNLGTPQLDAREARYLAPFWLTDEFRGANRVYHILNIRTDENGTTEISLGNSFVLAEPWTGMGNPRKFEYHALESFGLNEICPGLVCRRD